MRTSLLMRLFALLLVLASLVAAYTAWQQYNHAAIVINWATESEVDTAGFYLGRSESPTGPFERITPLVPASGDPLSGGNYEFLDEQVQPGVPYYYQLEEVELTGAAQPQGVIEAQSKRSGGLQALLAVLLLACGLLLLWIPQPTNAPISE